jgi:L,D-transpeptidase YbiS
MAELLYPLDKSLKVDIVGDAITLVRGRYQIDGIMSRLGSVRDEMRELEDSIAQTPVKLSRAAEDSLYLVVDIHNNRLFVRRGDDLLRTCVAATGSNSKLDTEGRSWFFATPRGIMTVQDKRIDPIWIKPDWAFVEEGKPIPPLNSPDRLVKDHLGAYALMLGGGIMIHGTTDMASLGRNASHGCIRLGADDLEYVYEASEIGTKVYIF